MKNLLTMTAALAATWTASADISVRTLPITNASSNTMYMSNDARVVVCNFQRTIDFVRNDYNVSSLPPQYYSFQPTGRDISGDGLVRGALTIAPSDLWGWILTEPPLGTSLASMADECGDQPAHSLSPDLSFDGSVATYNLNYIGDNACGYQAAGGRYRGVAWDRETGWIRSFQPSDFPDYVPGAPASQTNVLMGGVSDDGNRIAGTKGYESSILGLAFLFDRTAGTFTYPISGPTIFAASISKLSADGSAFMGLVQTGPSSGSATIKPYFQIEGSPLIRPDLDPLAQTFDSISVNDLANNAVVVVGSARRNSEPHSRAVMWDTGGQMTLLDDILLPLDPVRLCGWKFVSIHAVTPDGSTIVGEARNHLNQPVAFMARLSGSPLDPVGLRVAGDANADGNVNTADLSVLLSSFGSVVPVATSGDMNCDGFVNYADLSVLLSNFGD